MKIIIGRAGGGKSIKMLHKVAEYTSQGKKVRIITYEHTDGYKDLVGNLKIDAKNYSVTKLQPPVSLPVILAKILDDVTSQCIFIDVPMRYEVKDFSVLEAIERHTGKELYVTVQVPYGLMRDTEAMIVSTGVASHILFGGVVGA